ncbi:MAG TPA: class I SAM-dependent methyltransferase [Solirubrobacteraceae bacterium]|nr:class I SAM-dependent methyltransferase [Solirubrobacteraceae bacterium]
MPADEAIDVYATAARRGAAVRWLSRAAGRARRRRHERFFWLTRVGRESRILDVGCGALGLRAFEPSLDITGVDVAERPDYPGPFVQADAAVELPFEDGAFDLAYSNSVIEHVAPERRAAFARELRRVARGVFVQTPALGFPIDPHSLLPVAHWLPVALRQRYWRLGAAGAWEEISLLRRSELAALFETEPHAERVGPLVKSWIAIRPVPGNGGEGPAGH